MRVSSFLHHISIEWVGAEAEVYDAAVFVSAGAGVAKFVIDELDFIENYKVSEFFRKFTAFAMEMTDVTAKGS